MHICSYVAKDYRNKISFYCISGTKVSNQIKSNLYFDTVKNSSGFGTIYNYITIINNNKYVSKKSYL